MPPDSSTETAEGAQAPVETVSDVNPAASSPAEGVESPSHVDHVKAVLDAGKEASPASGEGSEPTNPETIKPEDAAEGDKAAAELTDEEIAALSARAQKRIRSLNENMRDAERQVESLKPRAENMDRIVSFCRDNQIQPNEFENALQVTAVINRGDYKKALDLLTPIYQQVAQKAGEILPEDIKERVRLGHISEQDARELHRSRTANANMTELQKRDQERRETENEQKQLSERVHNAATAVDDWAKGKAGSDPDWKSKQELVAEQIELVLRNPESYPKSKQEAVAIAEKALEVVETRLSKWKPKPQPIRNPSSGKFASPHSKAEPATHIDAVRQALEM